MDEVDLSGQYIALAIPTYDGRWSIEAAAATIQATQEMRKHGVRLGTIFQSGNSLIAHARNALLAKFLETEATHLLFLDSDVYFKPDDILRLLSWGTKKDVVAGCCPIRGHEKTFHITFLENERGGVETWEGRLLGVERIGMAFTLIGRHVVERLVEDHQDFAYKTKEGDTHFMVFDTVYKDGGYIGEDFVFCDKVRQAGFEIWADPSIEMWHEDSCVRHGHMMEHLSKLKEE